MKSAKTIKVTAAGSVMLAAACLAGVGAAPEPRRDQTVAELLAVAGRYVEEYETTFGAIVSEELYEQTANRKAAGDGPRRRVMRSDLLTYHSGALGWIAFRDVAEVDGVPIPDRSDRLLKLVYDPTSHAMEEAQRVTAESARYNIGWMTRTINVPTVALMFLRRENQPRSTFELNGTRIGKVNLAILTFKETGDPRIIETIDNAAAAGRFWIEPQSGRVVHTELTLSARRYVAKIVVEYADQPTIGLWVPVSMVENYTVVDETRRPGLSVADRTLPAVVTGKAQYRDFRKFETNARMIRK